MHFNFKQVLVYINLHCYICLSGMLLMTSMYDVRVTTHFSETKKKKKGNSFVDD